MPTGYKKMAASLPGMLTVTEAAQLMHVHPNTVRAWSDGGMLKSYRLGSRRDRRFKLEDIDLFLGSNGERVSQPD
ncbi:helix-turn-helix domain-containing protein [Chloroflexota bacterium]